MMVVNNVNENSPLLSPTTKKNRRAKLNFLNTYLPITTWLPSYTLHHLQCDFIAGVTVGLMVVPQALAYASLARLPSTDGLYSAYIGCFIYCLFGTSKDITIGPTAILSLMVQHYSVSHCSPMSSLLSFYVGCVLLIMGLFRLGFLVRFVSVPVISAFTTAAAITIACSQLKDLTGVQHTPRDFFGNIIAIFKHTGSWNFYDLAFGVACIIILFLMRFLAKLTAKDSNSKTKKIVYKVLWLLGIARNALIVLVSCLIVYIMQLEGSRNVFSLTEKIRHGMPPFKPPTFSPYCSYVNTTFSFPDTFDQFGTGLAIVPMLAFIETMAIGKAFSRRNSYKIHPTQELLALGLINIVGSFVTAFPVTGSFSRTAVNSQSGVKTPLAGIFTGVVVLFSLQFLTQIFIYLPKACLGAVIISAVLPMCDFPVVRSIWRVKRIDTLPYVATFAACFYSLELGLVLGIAFSLFIVLYYILNPTVDEELNDVTIFRIANGLFYPGCDRIIELIEDTLHKANPPSVIVLDMHAVTTIDFTFTNALGELVAEMKLQTPDIELFATNVCDSVKSTLIMARLHGMIVSPESLSQTYTIHRNLSDLN